MEAIRVVVSGSGFMGREVLRALCDEDDLEPVGVIEKLSKEEFVSLPTGDGRLVPMSDDPSGLIDRTRPDVVIDFSNAEWTEAVAKAAMAAGACMVIGTSGLSEDIVRSLADQCHDKKLGGVLASNFAIGAVVMMHLAKVAGRYFDYAEITEMHQEKKLDAPSGTALAMARGMVAARGHSFESTMPERHTVPGNRGAVEGGVVFHSQRMPGFVAHHEVTFGGLGQSLRIRHDSTGRESFIPGVLLAAREVMNLTELVIGLEKLIGLEP